jgi:hypothetical protein
MDREQAERERERLAEEHPEATWLVAEQHPGRWAVVRVGLIPTEAARETATEARPKPDHSEDPRSSQVQNAPYGNF